MFCIDARIIHYVQRSDCGGQLAIIGEQAEQPIKRVWTDSDATDLKTRWVDFEQHPANLLE